MLRGIKIAMKRISTRRWGEALNFGSAKNRQNAMKAFLDDKKFTPGLEHFKETT